VFFETDVGYVQGSVIIFAIELDGPAKKKLLLGEPPRLIRRAPGLSQAAIGS